MRRGWDRGRASHDGIETPRRRWWARSVWRTPAVIGETPSATWEAALADGYQVRHAVTIEARPHVFGEGRMYRVSGAEPGLPLDCSISYALRITEGMEVSVEIDRQTGVAAGRAVDILLGRQQLSDEGLLDDYFARPTLRTKLTSDVTLVTTSTIKVESTTGFTAPGFAWLGRECFRFNGLTSTAFTGVQRAVNGLAHYHVSDGESGYAYVTDRPTYWRGLLVTIWEHLCAPDGRYLGTHWATPATYCRELWTGYIDAPPKPTAEGMVLRALPLVRLPAQAVGAKYECEVISGAAIGGVGGEGPWIYMTADDFVEVTLSSGQTGKGPDTVLGWGTLNTWAQQAAEHITDDTAAVATVAIEVVPWNGSFELLISIYPFATVTATIRARAWFLGREVSRTVEVTTNGASRQLIVRFSPNDSPTAWLSVLVQRDALDNLNPMPSSGYGLLEVDGVREIVRWDQATAINNRGHYGLRLVGRELGGTPRVDPWALGGKLQVLSGTEGTLAAALQTLATSSGTGDRGPYDTLAFGFGLGLPQDRIADLNRFPLSTQSVAAVSDGAASISDLLGGWLALMRLCLVQRRNDDGVVVLDVVDTSVVTGYAEHTIGADDVLLGEHGAAEPIEPPNQLEITGATVLETDTVVIIDRARVQAEGQRAWKLAVPGGADERSGVVRMGADILRLADGQAAVELALAPHASAIQPGDTAELTTAHPLLFDWSSGAWSPSSVYGRVMTWRHSLYSKMTWVKLLLAGQAQESFWLCPSATVTAVVSSTSIRVARGDSTGFTASDEIAIYRPGDEGTYANSRVISTVTEGLAEDTITLTGSVPSWVKAGDVLTFDVYGTVGNNQRRFMYCRSDRYWR